MASYSLKGTIVVAGTNNTLIYKLAINDLCTLGRFRVLTVLCNWRNLHREV